MDQPSSTSDENIENGEAPLLEIDERAQATAGDAKSGQEVVAQNEPGESSQEVVAQDRCITGMNLEVYKAARTGNRIDEDLLPHGEGLSQILTPTKNTVLHIYIACPKRSRTLGRNEAILGMIDKILVACPELLMKANERGETTLHMAAKHGHDHIVQHLINKARARQGEAGFQQFIRTVNNEGDTALHEAVRFNHLPVVVILTREDREALYSANGAGETPLYMAAERGYKGIVSNILTTLPKSACDGPDDRTALHAAVIYNDEQMMIELLGHYGGNDERDLTRAVDKIGWTPLHYSASHGYSSLVKRLVGSNKCAAYVRDKNDKKTALHVASAGGHLDVIRELISHCPDCCEVVDKRHRNILHYAIENKKYHILEFVRKDPWLSSVLLNGKDDDRNTPLHQLIASFKTETFVDGMFPPRILISSSGFISDVRVDKMTFNKKNKNAFDIIHTNDTISNPEKKEIETYLKRYGGRPGERIEEGNELEEGQGIELAREELHQIVKEDQGSELVRVELQQVNLIMATLIAAVTFAAGLTVPGGFFSEGQERGLSVLRKHDAFFVFSVFNAVAMISSSTSVLLHVYWVMYKKTGGHDWLLLLTIEALVCMVFGFICGTYAINGKSQGNLTLLDAGILSVFTILVVSGKLNRIYRNVKRRLQDITSTLSL